MSRLLSPYNSAVAAEFGEIRMLYQVELVRTLARALELKCKSNRAKIVVEWTSFSDAIGIGESLAAFPLPHHRAYGSVHGASVG